MIRPTAWADGQPPHDVRGKIDLLREQFVQRCLADAAVLDRALGDPSHSAHSPDTALIGKLAHRMAGAAAVFGLPDLGAAAERLEDAAGGMAQTGDDLAGAASALVSMIRGLTVVGVTA